MRITRSIEAEIKTAKAEVRAELEELLEVIADHLGIKKCPYCGKYDALSYTEDHDEDLCDDCAEETPERLIGDEIQYRVDGRWVGRFGR